MLPTPPSKDDNAKDSKRYGEEVSSLKRNSVAGLSFSLSSLTSPKGKGVVSTATSKVSPGRRPDTPPDVAKAWQATPASTSRLKESGASKPSPARNAHASPLEKTRADHARVVDKGIHSWSDSV